VFVVVLFVFCLWGCSVSDVTLHFVGDADVANASSAWAEVIIDCLQLCDFQYQFQCVGITVYESHH
jgi:hypothetical protein